jgi:hypothetical protein
MSDLKIIILRLLESNALSDIADNAARYRRVLSHLIRLSYAKDTLVGWRAIIAVGMAARKIVATDRAFLRATCRKLLWSLTDESGGIGWSAPELLGEIISADPRGFADLIPLIASVYGVEEDVFRPGVVYALSRIAESAPELVLDQQKVIMFSLHDKDPLVRAFGLQLAGALWETAIRTNAWSQEFNEKVCQAVKHLNNDSREVWVYQDDGFQSVIVKDIAMETIRIVS